MDTENGGNGAQEHVMSGTDDETDRCMTGDICDARGRSARAEGRFGRMQPSIREQLDIRNDISTATAMLCQRNDSRDLARAPGVVYHCSGP